MHFIRISFEDVSVCSTVSSYVPCLIACLQLWYFSIFIDGFCSRKDLHLSLWPKILKASPRSSVPEKSLGSCGLYPLTVHWAGGETGCLLLLSCLLCSPPGGWDCVDPPELQDWLQGICSIGWKNRILSSTKSWEREFFIQVLVLRWGTWSLPAVVCSSRSGEDGADSAGIQDDETHAPSLVKLSPGCTDSPRRECVLKNLCG